MRLNLQRGVKILIMILVGNNILLSQDSHYWTNQYGTRGNLLSGLVVGSVKDLSSSFYNPGAIPLSPEQSLVLTTDAVEISALTIKNGAAKGKDLTTRQSGTSPGIFAIRLTSSASVKNHWVFSYITRNNYKLDINIREVDSRPPGTGNLTQDYFAGEFLYSQKVDEAWAGITYGRNIRNRLAFGITQYLAYRSQKIRNQLITQEYNPSGGGYTLAFMDEFQYDHFRILWKFGLSAGYHPFSFGFTITTPSLGILGFGQTFVNYSQTIIDTTNITGGISALASDYQTDLPSKYRSPLSIAAGATYYFQESSVYFSLEWFDKISKYRILDPEPFIGQSSGILLSPPYEHELKSITNFGLGFQHSFSKKLSIYISGILDKSARISKSETQFAISNWDIYHLTLGSAFTFWRLDLTGGLTYSYGNKNFEQSITYREADSGILEEPFNPTKAIYRRIKLILGF